MMNDVFEVEAVPAAHPSQVDQARSCEPSCPAARRPKLADAKLLLQGSMNEHISRHHIIHSSASR